MVPFRASGGLIHVIVDTPRDSRNKYKFDEATGLFKLSRILPQGLHFPCDFGFIPQTRGEDGDALDVALYTDSSSFVGCLMTVRLLGVINAQQTESGRNIRNDRLLAIPVTPVNKPKQRQLHDLPKLWLKDLEQFFIAYNAAHGRIFKPLSRRGSIAAMHALRAGVTKYQESSVV